MWFCLCLPFCGPVFESQAHLLHIFQFVFMKLSFKMELEKDKNKRKRGRDSPSLCALFKCFVSRPKKLFKENSVFLKLTQMRSDMTQQTEMATLHYSPFL